MTNTSETIITVSAPSSSLYDKCAADTWTVKSIPDCFSRDTQKIDVFNSQSRGGL